MTGKMLVFEYNGVKYSHAPLSFEKLTDFGLSIMQKLGATGSVIACVVGQKLVKDELYSFQKCMSECLNPDDFKWLINEFVYNPDSCLYINDKPVSVQEAGEHFEGNFMLLYAVCFSFASQCVGECNALTSIFSGSFKSIADSLNEILEVQIERAEQSLSSLVKSQAEGRAKSKQRRK